MPSLRQLTATLAPLLILDAASSRVQVGIFGVDGLGRWEHSDAESGIALFECIDRLGVDVQQVRAFAFCEGPGSILGIRTAAMALRTWCVLSPRPLFAYCGLAVVAHALGRPDLTVIADARRSGWHAFKHGGPWACVAATALSGDLAMPEGFRHWSPLPAGTVMTPYGLKDLFKLRSVDGAELFRATDEPEAFRHEEPVYAAWTPHVHRAPAAP